MPAVCIVNIPALTAAVKLSGSCLSSAFNGGAASSSHQAINCPQRRGEKTHPRSSAVSSVFNFGDFGSLGISGNLHYCDHGGATPVIRA
jgi:hypothetical protein